MIKAVFPQNLFAGKGRLFILSIAVGVITAVAVVLLERLSHTCRALAVNLSQLGTWMQWVVPAFPAAAILLCVLCVRFILRREK